MMVFRKQQDRTGGCEREREGNAGRPGVIRLQTGHVGARMKASVRDVQDGGVVLRRDQARRGTTKPVRASSSTDLTVGVVGQRGCRPCLDASAFCIVGPLSKQSVRIWKEREKKEDKCHRSEEEGNGLSRRPLLIRPRGSQQQDRANHCGPTVVSSGSGNSEIH